MRKAKRNVTEEEETGLKFLAVEAGRVTLEKNQNTQFTYIGKTGSLVSHPVMSQLAKRVFKRFK